MYVSVLGYNLVNGRREHLGTITNITYTNTRRVFDPDTTSLIGKSDVKFTRPLIAVINDDKGRQFYAGFYKNDSPSTTKSEKIEFKIDDFKTILDTDIILDFSNDLSPDFSWTGIITKVTNQIKNSKDPFINKVPLEFIIPADSTSTLVIADYSKQYLVVNVKQFLKVYLAYFNYYVAASYDVVLDKIVFEFKKQPLDRVSIKLKDFVHEKTSTDITYNTTEATISHATIENESSWEDSDVGYYNAQLSSNRASIIAAETPDPNGYPTGFALRKVSSLTYLQVTYGEYASALIKKTVMIQQYGINVCYVAPDLTTASTAAGNANNLSEGTVVRVMYQVNSTGEQCTGFAIYLQVVPVSATYHKRSDVTFKPRPSMPSKIYSIGTDNEIYSGYAPDDKRIFPVKLKIFESNYLYTAQFDAVYELVNNRYVENIIITQDKLVTTIDLESIDLYTMFRVFDDNGEFKDIPMSEKTFVHEETKKHTQIKLGFKKQLLTDILSGDIKKGPPIRNAVSGGGGTTVQKFEVSVGEETPNPAIYNTWFKTISEEESMLMMMSSPSGGELSVESMDGEFIEPTDTPSEDGTELTVEGASPYEETY